MIKVEIKKNQILIKGHAGYADFGKDIVCAAVTSIASGLFYECSSLSEIEIPNTVTSIGSNALECCAFVELTIPASVTSIDYFAMNYNNYLKKVTFEGSITTGDHDILSYCPMLEEVVFNGNMTTIYQSMFENDAKLSKIILPSTVTTIGYGAFSGCSSLKSINIPEGVTTIYGEAFKDCKLFTTITLPTTLTEIKSDAFKGCYALAEVYNLSTDLTVTAGSDSNGMVAYYAKAIHTSSTDPSSIVTDTNGYVFLYDGAKGYLIGYTGSSYRLDLPNSFEYNGTEITSYEISAYAFYQNKNIYSIKIPASVTAIGENAFKECFHLVEIYNTSSLEITRGNSSNGYVSYYALVVNQSNTADSILIFDANEYVFAIADGVNCVIGYTGTATDLVIPGQFTYNDVIYTDLFINRYSFAYSNITSLVVSSGVKKLGQYAFAYNYSLKSVEVADTVVNFDYHPFYACYAVEYVKGSSRICAYIGNPYNYSDKNYSYNDYLTTVIITKGNSIDSYAFCKNTSLKTIVIPVTVTGIGTYSGNTFYNVTLEKIFYGGTRSQFYNIQGIYYSGNDTAITNATKYFYSEETPTDTENNYWHWVDDVPTPW